MSLTQHPLSAAFPAMSVEDLTALQQDIEAFGQREAIVLIALEEMSYRDAADIIGVPIGTVMSRLSRGREALRAILAEQGQSVLRRVK